ncbi:MAG: hypothetical protein R6V47_03680, partial [Candidatus Delongbacteria bacterium]
SKAPFAFRTDWLHQTGSPDSMAFVRTSGNKLDGELPDNSMVLVDRSQNIVTNGAPYLLRVRAELEVFITIMTDIPFLEVSFQNQYLRSLIR